MRILGCVWLAILLSTAARAQRVQAYETDPDQGRLLELVQPNLAFAPPSPSTATLPSISVNDAVTYQTMDGFGASLTDSSAWLLSTKVPAAQLTDVMRSLFDPVHGIGISMLRQPMGASDFAVNGDYSYDDQPSGQMDLPLAHFSITHDQAYVTPLLRRAISINPSLKIMALPWSPPAWMKSGGSMNGGSVRTDIYPALAQYFVRFVQAYAQEKIPIYALAMQNEPLFQDSGYPTAGVTATEQARFIGQYLGPALNAAGLGGIKVLAYEHNWDHPEYPLAVLGDPAAARYLAGASFHCYGGDVSAQAQVHTVFPNQGIWFTECTGSVGSSFGGDLAWNAHNLFIGAVRNWARSVTLWNVALDQNSGPKNGGCSKCRGLITIDTSVTPPRITRNVEYYLVGHVAKFVQPGAVRVDSSNAAAAPENVAFRNPDGSVVLLALNSASSAQTFAVTWKQGAFSYNLPAGALVTFVWNVPQPSFPAAGVVNAADPNAPLSPGSLISIYGENLAADNAAAPLTPLPLTMKAASIEAGGLDVPLLYVSPLQINAQLPWELQPGPVTLTVSHSGESATETVEVEDAGPALFTLDGTYAAALNGDLSINSQSNPAHAGQTLVLFGTGSGPVMPAAVTGDAAPISPLLQVPGAVLATIDQQPATVLFAGMAPGFAGLLQINVMLPASLPAGALPVTITIGTRTSKPVLAWVQP